METLINAGLVEERRQEGYLSYLLQQPGQLSATGYKVLQSQQQNGFVRCIRVLENGRDKLVYDVEGLQPLAQLLPHMSPEDFGRAAAGVLDIAQRLGEIGFLQLSGLELSLDKIYLQPQTGAPCLVYLPLAESILASLGTGAVGALKGNFVWALENHKNLGTKTLSPFYTLLRTPAAGLGQLREALGTFAPWGQPQAKPTIGTMPTGTSSLSGTGEMGRASGDITVEAPLQQEPAPESRKKKISLFGKEKKRAGQSAPAYPEYEGGGTEVLDEVFSPLIVLEGIQTPKKLAFLVDKRQFVIGKSAEAVDGLIDFSTAVSRKHCYITSNEGKNYLTDLASANGTFLNGRKLDADKPALIHEGDKIKLANISFVVKDI